MKTCFVLLALSFSLLAHTSAAPPNIVVFLADDAGWGDYSFSGNTQIETPNIDSIAIDGVSLEHFYVAPVCAPTRAEFLTGRYYLRSGVRGVSTGQERLNVDEKTLADAFQAAGYATGAFGKWHNGSQWPYHPMARGFDTYFGHTAGHWGEYFNAPLENEGRMVKTEGYIVDVCTDRAIAFIEENCNAPFFCYIPFTTPHSPWAAPKEYWDRFKDKAITQRGSLPEQEIDDETRCALAMVENQDWNVGRVLSKIEELNLTGNTLIVYFSDNGPNSMRWNGGMKGKKGQTDEGGVRSVCYLRWPGHIPAGHQVAEISGAIDLLPTLTSLAGIPRVGDKPLDGIDLSPLLLNESPSPWPERTLFSTWAGQVSARTQTHRMDSKGNLYDMLADPGQTTPINAQVPKLVDALTNEVRVWHQEIFGTKAPANLDFTESNRAWRKERNTVDPRPFPVGYREFPITMLPARDGTPYGQVKRSSQAPNWYSPKKVDT